MTEAVEQWEQARRRAPRNAADRAGRTASTPSRSTFGLKLAGWASSSTADDARVARALDEMRVGKLSGAVGTYAPPIPS